MALLKTDGNFKFSGKLSIDKSEVKDLGWIKKLGFSIKTRSDNFVNLTIESKNDKGLPVKVKLEGDTEATEFTPSVGMDYVKENFTNSNFAFIVGVTNYDSYYKKLVFNPTGVYHASEKNFDDDNFNETNSVEQEIIFDSYAKGKVKGLCVTFFGEVVEVEFKVEDEDLIAEFESFKYGDLLKINYQSIKEPNYVETVEVEKTTTGYVPKGKVNKPKKTNRTIDGYVEKDLIIGIEDCVSGKYTRQEVRSAIEEYEAKQQEYANKNNAPKTGVVSSDIEEEDLPY